MAWGDTCGKIKLCFPKADSDPCPGFESSVDWFDEGFENNLFSTYWEGGDPPTGRIDNNYCGSPGLTAGQANRDPGNLTVRCRTSSGLGPVVMTIEAGGMKPGDPPTDFGSGEDSTYSWGVGVNAFYNSAPSRQSAGVIQIKQNYDDNGNLRTGVVARVVNLIGGMEETELIPMSTGATPVDGYTFRIEIEETTPDMYLCEFFVDGAKLHEEYAQWNLSNNTTSLGDERCDIPVSFTTLGLLPLESLVGKVRGYADYITISVN